MLMAVATSVGCQSDYAGQTLPSPYWQKDDIQYFPPGPEFKLSREAAAMKTYGTGRPSRPAGAPWVRTKLDHDPVAISISQPRWSSLPPRQAVLRRPAPRRPMPMRCLPTKHPPVKRPRTTTPSIHSSNQ